MNPSTALTPLGLKKCGNCSAGLFRNGKLQFCCQAIFLSLIHIFIQVSVLLSQKLDLYQTYPGVLFGIKPGLESGCASGLPGRVRFHNYRDAAAFFRDVYKRQSRGMENALLFAGKNYIITKTNSRHRQGEKAWIGKWGKY